MFTRTLIATLTAGVIGAASLGAMTATASAHQSYGQQGYGPGPDGPNMYYKPAPDRGSAYGGWVRGPGWQLRFGDFKPFPEKPLKPIVQKVCGPTFKQVQVWNPYKGWVWQKVYAGQGCRLEKIYPTKGPMYPYPSYPYPYRNW